MLAPRRNTCCLLCIRDNIKIDVPIYYMPDGAFAPKEAEVVGPSAATMRSERVQEVDNDTFIEPFDVWSTDHKDVWMTFKPVRKN